MARESSHAAERNDRMQWSKDAIAAVWGDRLSRVSAIVAAVSLWLTVTLTEPAFLAPLFGGAFGIWYLRSHRALLRHGRRRRRRLVLRRGAPTALRGCRGGPSRLPPCLRRAVRARRRGPSRLLGGRPRRAALGAAPLGLPRAQGVRRAHATSSSARSTQWDANWFLRIAQHGYDIEAERELLPALPAADARASALVLRSDLVAGVAISLVAAGLAGVAVMRIARRLRRRTRRTRLRSLPRAVSDQLRLHRGLLGRAVPRARGLGVPVSRSRAERLLAALLGALAVLTRPTGLALLPALRLAPLARARQPVAASARARCCCCPPRSRGYCVYLSSHFGDAFAFVHSEGSFWLRHVPATGPLGGAWARAEVRRAGRRATRPAPAGWQRRAVRIREAGAVRDLERRAARCCSSPRARSRGSAGSGWTAPRRSTRRRRSSSS